MSFSVLIMKIRHARVVLKTKINRGTEAARAAVEIANVMSELRDKQGAAVSKPPREDG